jgi:hypothetical protein
MRTIALRCAYNPNGPIRTYRETVEAMRKQGDKTITIQHIHWYEQSALKKLRKLLAGMEREVE